MATWIWKSWGGRRRSVEADLVEFTPQHVAFFSQTLNAKPQLILAIQERDCSDLHPEDEGDPVWW